MPQDPVKQEPEAKPSVLGDNAGRTAALNELMKALQSNQKLRHAEESHTQKMAIEQAKAIAGMQTEQQSAKLQNQQTELKMELDLAKAAQEGAVPIIQDPVKPVAPERYQNKELHDALALMRKRVENQSALNLNSREVTDKLSQQLSTAADEAMTEKSLRYARGGIFGQLLGDVLDLVVPFAGLGTEIFGRAMPADRRAEFLASNLYKTSPLVRTELNNLVAQEKLERGDAKNRLTGLPRTASVVQGNGDMTDMAYNTQIEISSILGNSPDQLLSSTFSSEALLGRGINLFQQNKDRLGRITSGELNDSQALALLEQTAIDEERAQTIAEEYFNSGGSPEQLARIVKTAQEKVTEEFIRPIDPSLPYNKHQQDMMIARNLSANEYLNMLTDWQEDMTRRAGFNERIQRTAKNKELYARFDQSIKDEGLTDPKVLDTLQTTPTIREELINNLLDKFPKEMRKGFRERIDRMFKVRKEQVEYAPRRRGI